ncbi:hypothetical protein Tco_1503615 [Tanacetum coccineum]
MSLPLCLKVDVDDVGDDDNDRRDYDLIVIKMHVIKMTGFSNRLKEAKSGGDSVRSQSPCSSSSSESSSSCIWMVS